MAPSVLIVDDDEVLRRIVRRILEKNQEFTVVGEAKDGEEAIRLVGEVRPEVIVMDIAMPRLDGLQATRRIKRTRPETQVIILTLHDEEAYRRAALACGAAGFVLKTRIFDLYFEIKRVISLTEH